MRTEANSGGLRAIVGWSLCIGATILGVLALYQLITAWVPSEGWTNDNFLTLGIAFFTLFGGGTEVLKRVRIALPKDEDSKRCGSCGAMVPLVAKFCRECGRQLQQVK